MLFLVTTLLTSCIQMPATKQALSPALVVLPGAIGVNHTAEYDGSVEYFVNDPYPGSIAISGIGERMKKLGWSETDDWIGPKSPISPQRDWGSYVEGDTEVFALTKAWKDRSGYLITYFISYRVKPLGAQATRMEIKAVRMSPDTIKQLRAAFDKVP
jgi:hypothetical protein